MIKLYNLYKIIQLTKNYDINEFIDLCLIYIINNSKRNKIFLLKKIDKIYLNHNIYKKLIILNNITKKNILFYYLMNVIKI